MAIESAVGEGGEETPLAPDLPIIDPHHHVRDRPGARYLFDDFLADLSGCGHTIRATVIIESGDMSRAGGPPELKPVGEVEFLNGVAAMFASGKYGTTQVGTAGRLPGPAPWRARAAGCRGMHHRRRRPVLRRAQSARLA
jgi:hypothetical protein